MARKRSFVATLLGRKRKPKKWSPKPKLYRIARKNAERNKGYKRFWKDL